MEGYSADNVTEKLVPYSVWTYDGNIEYLKGRHEPLFVVALLFLILLFLPYTLLLTFGQFLRSIRVRTGLKWINSTAFISVMDAYHAPYNRRHRYWTGLLLLTRCILFITFATNFEENALLSNMYAIVLVTIAILVIKLYASDTYKVSLMKHTEISFLLNLAVLAATVYYLEGKADSKNATCKCITASLSVGLIGFSAILAYHTYLQTKGKRWFVSLKRAILDRWKTGHEEAVQVNTSHISKFIELREELLGSV